jgi:hypothetical protein
MRITTLLTAGLLLTGLCHYTWFARPIDEADLAQVEASEVNLSAPAEPEID